MFAKSSQVLKLKTGKEFLDVTLDGEDDLDFLLHGTTWLEHGCTAGPCQDSTSVLNYDVDTDKTNFHK